MFAPTLAVLPHIFINSGSATAYCDLPIRDRHLPPQNSCQISQMRPPKSGDDSNVWVVAVVKTARADLSSGIVVVQVHEGARRVATLGAPFPRVDERLGEGAAVGDVVRTAGPLEARVAGGGVVRGGGGTRSLDGAVAAAAVQQAGAARSRDGVRHPGRRDGVHERRLPGTCNQPNDNRASHVSHPGEPPSVSSQQYQ